MSKVRHVIGISGGKDSAALAIYLGKKYADLSLEYYFCDTGKELDETYELIEKIEIFLGVKVEELNTADKSYHVPFDHFLGANGGYLPSSTSRWCTQKMKLEPFEKYVGDDPVISYVGIRGDENREGYISTKPNIQSIFPFRKNIWSQDVIKKVLGNNKIEIIANYYRDIADESKIDRMLEIVNKPLSMRYMQDHKLDNLLSLGVKEFNRVVLRFIREFTEYPLAKVDYFPLVDNEDVLIRNDIFKILRDSGVGVPAYYEKVEFEVNGKKGTYARSRSGCFFCFFQQKIEWVWLYEQHPDLYQKAMDYEKEGYSWSDSERLEDLIRPERIEQIKENYIKAQERSADRRQSPFLLDILDDAEGEGCAACFI